MSSAMERRKASTRSTDVTEKNGQCLVLENLARINKIVLKVRNILFVKPLFLCNFSPTEAHCRLGLTLLLAYYPQKIIIFIFIFQDVFIFEYVQHHVCFVNVQQSSWHEIVIFSVCVRIGSAAYIIPTHLPANLRVKLPAHLTENLNAHLPDHLPAQLTFHLPTTCLPTYMHTCLQFCLQSCQSSCLSA